MIYESSQSLTTFHTLIYLLIYFSQVVCKIVLFLLVGLSFSFENVGAKLGRVSKAVSENSL